MAPGVGALGETPKQGYVLNQTGINIYRDRLTGNYWGSAGVRGRMSNHTYLDNRENPYGTRYPFPRCRESSTRNKSTSHKCGRE